MVLTNRLLDIRSDDSVVLNETESINFQSLDLELDVDASLGKATVTVNPKVIRKHAIPMAIALG